MWSLRLIRWAATTFPDGLPIPLRLPYGLIGLAGKFSTDGTAKRPPQALRDLVKGKRVCLTGPSKCVLQNDDGFLDSFDVVVRLNNTWPVPPQEWKAMGRRCDIWYHVGNGGCRWDEALDDFRQIKHLRTMPHYRGHTLVRCFGTAARGLKLREPTEQPIYDGLIAAADRYQVPRSDFHHCRSMPYLNRLGLSRKHHVNTGFFAICELLDCDPEELFITGITFCREFDITRYSDKKGRRGREGPQSHHYADELFEFFKIMARRDSRITPDNTLKQIIESSEHEEA